MKKILSLSVVASIALFSQMAIAGNTTFFSSNLGDIVFPFSPPASTTGAPGTIDNMVIGATTPQSGKFSSILNTSPTPLIQGAPASQDTAATLTAAQLSAGILTSNPAAAIALTLPLATAMDTAFPASVAGSAFDFSVISIAGSTNLPTVTTNTGWTLVGSMIFTATAGNAGRFRARKTGTGAWVLYRLS